MRIWFRRLMGLVATLALASLLWYGLAPAPVWVEVAQIERGPMRVTIDEDGKTRLRERYLVSTPLTGQLRRIELHAGDAIVAGVTLLAAIEPRDPSLLDARALAQAEALVRAARAASLQAEARQELARDALGLARHTLSRARELVARKAATQEDLDTAEHKERMAAEDLRAAEFGVQLTRFELEQAEAALLFSRPTSVEPAAPPPPFEIHAPVSGSVLRVFQESSAVVEAGTQLVEVGDPHDLELEIDVLSADAVQIRPGALVLIEHWGGAHALSGRVRVVEPSGFLKVSALGVEEQRVNVIASFEQPFEERRALGDAYRVEARIVVWEGKSVLKVPAGALFRRRNNWGVFVLANGRAEERAVRIGHHNGVEAEVLEGPRMGDQVVLHPSDRVVAGGRLRVRKLDN